VSAWRVSAYQGNGIVFREFTVGLCGFVRGVCHMC
jgi:hypothetical protein